MAMIKGSIVLVITSLVLVESGIGAPAVDNPHGESKIGCEKCHVTVSWTEVDFAHEGIGFDLTLSHRGINCVRCHDLKDFSKASTACRGCHPDVHSSRMGTDCERCHTPLQWDTFDPEEIHSRTRFPLLDRHIQIDCRNCHPGLLEGDFATSASDCVDCHEDRYLSASVPPHVSLGIGTLCAECHEPVRWRPAFFPSHDAIFPIFSGEHGGVWNMCEDCHPEPSSFSVFSCFACHQRAEMDEEHGDISGYSYDNQACLGCHPTGSGEGGISQTHDSSFFPIFSGPHASTWDACSDCHDVTGDFGAFTCLGCHEHSQGEMDGRHQGIAGYSYDSAQCYGCHPTGEGGQFLAHDQDYFPIYSGAHASTWDTCSDCHDSPDDPAAFTCLGCHEHGQSEMDNQHSGIPGYSYDSRLCLGCHPDGEGGDFREHDGLYFPIYSGKHGGTWDDCAVCHTDPNDWSVFSCIGCHEHRQSEMDDEHKDVNGYIYDSRACYDCHPDGEELIRWKEQRVVQ